MIPPALATLFAKPLVRYGFPVVAIVIAVIAFRWWLSDVKENAAKEAVQTERQEQAADTLNRVERAINATEAIRRDPDARRAECLRHARNPEDC